MIIEFSVENFLSFKDLATLSMVAVKPFKEHPDTHLIQFDDKLNLLKAAIIYGNNASGKSNLLEAMGFMKSLVLGSFRDALVENGEKKFSLEKFALNSQSEKESSFFEISFIQKNIKYRYGFEIDYDKIVAEWLFHTTTKEVYLFKRDFQKIDINKSSFKEAVGKTKDVKENVLFLSLLATLGKDISSDIVDWFKKMKFINGIHDVGHKRYTIDKLKTDEKFLSWVLHFIKYLEISSVATTEQEVSDSDFDRIKNRDEDLFNLLATIQKIQSKQPKKDQLVTYHRKYDENNVFIDTIAFNFDKQESEGTKKLIYLLGPWYDSLQNGNVLVVDELDSRLHNRLSVRLIDYFHKFNENNAQLICAVHDISLLDKDLFRRDQIWFIDKNQFGASELVSLGDFKTDKVRNKSAFDKNYVEGKYGAIPYFYNNDEELKELLYGEAR